MRRCAKGETETHRFLNQAKELFDEGHYDLAVVAAQIHLELQLRLLLERAAMKTGARWAKRLAKSRQVASLGQDLSLVAVELLLDVDVTQSSFWESFDAHRVRRNDIVHSGRAVDRNAAPASIRVVQDLWAKLAERSGVRRSSSAGRPIRTTDCPSRSDGRCGPGILGCRKARARRGTAAESSRVMWCRSSNEVQVALGGLEVGKLRALDDEDALGSASAADGAE